MQYVCYLLQMASHFKWYPSSEEVTVPFNARYNFPSQANKAVKITPRIPPKSGQSFSPGSIIRVEFPAQGYVNAQNTTLEFDVTLLGFPGQNAGAVWFQNNIQSIFTRVRLLYGATPLEDIINYNVIVRALTEWTATEQLSSLDQTSIAEGIGGTMYGMAAGNTADSLPWSSYGGVFKPQHSRRDFIQGIRSDHEEFIVPSRDYGQSGVTAQPNQSYCTRRYQVNFALGLFTQEKLIPTKFMASQLAIELTLATVDDCIIAIPEMVTAPLDNLGATIAELTVNPFYAGAAIPYRSAISLANAATKTSGVNYFVSSVNLIPEILEFDASYDAMFLKGLREGGVPIKFSSWHTYVFGNGGGTTLNLLIQERSRSVKSIFTVQRRATPTRLCDSGAMHFSTLSTGNATSTLMDYQYRIGGRYFPASPCILSTGTVSNGGAEAYIELQKCLNTMGDYRLSTAVNTLRWATQPTETQLGFTVFPGTDTPFGGPRNRVSSLETDYNAVFVKTNPDTGAGMVTNSQSVVGMAITPGNMGSACFTMSTNLETSSGMEISGLNAEEQSDISLIAHYSVAQNGGNITPGGFNMETYCFYDAMLILRENNVLELIQ